MTELETITPSYIDAALVLDRQEITELLKEPQISYVTLAIADDDGGERQRIGKIRDVAAISADNMISRILTIARSATRALADMVTVLVTGHDGDGDVLRIATFMMQGQGEEGRGVGRGQAEPMNANDVVGHLVRQNEFLIRQTLASHAAVHIECESLRRRDRDRERERLDFIREREDFLTQKHDREMESRMVEQKIINNRDLKEKLLVMAQIALNKVNGTPLVRMKQSPFEAASWNVLQRLGDKAVIDKLFETGIISAEDRLAIAAWFEAGMETIMVSPEEKRLAQEAANSMMQGAFKDGQEVLKKAVTGDPSAAATNLLADIVRMIGVKVGGGGAGGTGGSAPS